MQAPPVLWLQDPPVYPLSRLLNLNQRKGKAVLRPVFGHKSFLGEFHELPAHLNIHLNGNLTFHIDACSYECSYRYS